MDDRAVAQLVDTLDQPSVRSLVLVPAESPASVHVRRNGRHGWVVELDCRGRLSHDLEAVVAHGSAPADPGTCELDVHSDARVHVTIRARERGMLQRVLQVLVSEHRRARPRPAWPPSSWATTAPAPRRIDVVLPPRPRACRSASLWGATARASLPRVPTPV